jgi:hypothetical protein
MRDAANGAYVERRTLQAAVAGRKESGMNRRISGWSVVAVCAMALAAEGATTTLLSDNFNEDTPGDGQRVLTNWVVTRGSVDVEPVGKLGVSDRGQFLDMDGTDTFAAKMQSKQDFTLSPGQYTLSFDVGGSMRDYVTAPNTMTVSLGDVFSTTVTKNFNDPFVSESFPITVSSATTGRLVFDHAGGDFVGMLLDNVLLTQETPSGGPVPIPLPAAVWTGMGTLGVIALVGGVRRRRRVRG